MFCKKCGKEIDNSAKFCCYCGEAQNSLQAASDLREAGTAEPVTDSDRVTEPKIQSQTQLSGISRKKLTAGIVILAALIVTGAGGYIFFLSPQAKLNHAIKQGEIAVAGDIYQESLYDKELSSQTRKLLLQNINSLQADYFSGEKEYESIADKLERYEIFAFDEEVEDCLKTVRETIEEDKWEREKLKSAEEELKAENYRMAIRCYRQILERHKDSQAGKEGFETAVESYLQYVESQTERYNEAGDFSASKEEINNAIELLPDDERFEVLLHSVNRAEEEYTAQQKEKGVQTIIEEAQESAESGDWEHAVEILENAPEEYRNETRLVQAIEEMKEKMPVTLKNMTVVSSDAVDVVNEEIQDRLGRRYRGGVLYDASNNAYGLYNLNQQFTEFKGVLFPAVEAENGKNMSISIYLDEELVYFKDGITEETAPFEIVLDVTGCRKMQIASANAGTYPYGWFYLGDTDFTKAEEQISDNSQKASPEKAPADEAPADEAQADETPADEMSLEGICQTVADHYNTLNDTDIYMVFEEECTKTGDSYSLLLRSQSGGEANALAGIVEVNAKTGEVVGEAGDSWNLY